MPGVRRACCRRRDAPSSVDLHGLRAADIDHRRDGHAQDQAAAAHVVLGGVPGLDVHPGISAKQSDSASSGSPVMRPRGRCCTSCGPRWSLPSELLKDEVEIDEFYLGGYEEGLKGGRQHAKKVLCGVAIEVRGRGSGRVRLAVLPDASRSSLLAFTTATTRSGAIVHSDGLQCYRALAKHGYDHRRRTQTAAAPGEQLLPARTARSATSKRGCTAPTAASHPST